MLGIVLLANVIKYPAFRFGPYYAAITGRSLIDGYANLGKTVLLLVALSQFFVQVIVIAATGITTAGILIAVFDLSLDARYLGGVSIVVAAILLMKGGYSILDRFSKVFVVVLTVATFVATFSVLPLIQWNSMAIIPSDMDFKTFAFVVALMGFMPSALDLSILHSLWAVEKARINGQRPPTRVAMLDFNIGYCCSAVLAVCFLLMGAGVMNVDGIVPASNSGDFADQVIELYTQSLGQWSGAVVGLAALCVMFTTLMTVLDGMPRMQATAIRRLLEPQNQPTSSASPSLHYVLVLIQGMAAILILLFMMNSFTGFIDFVTITSFLVAPIIALLNHLLVFNQKETQRERPPAYLFVWSASGILIMLAISATYFVTLLRN